MTKLLKPKPPVRENIVAVFHITGDGATHPGKKEDCKWHTCKKRRKKPRPKSKNGSKKNHGTHKLVKCLGCSKEIRASKTGFCSDCYKELRGVIYHSFGKGKDSKPKTCRFTGCDKELSADNKSGYCGECYNKASRWIHFLNKKGDEVLAPFQSLLK
jgi:hypothetical protein